MPRHGAGASDGAPGSAAAEAPRQAAEPFAEEGTGRRGAGGGLSAGAAQVGVAVSLSRLAAGAGLAGDRGEPGPADEVGGRGEPGHVQAGCATRGRTLRVSLREGGPVNLTDLLLHLQPVTSVPSNRIVSAPGTGARVLR
jgi:hypothetical protein